MYLIFIEKKARQLMDQHGLHDWNFKWNKSRKAAGWCVYKTKTIILSKIIAEGRDVFMTIDTILHEIAHALTPGHGHDKIWKAKAIQIGCNGRRCYDDHVVEDKWVGICPVGHKWYRRRRPDGVILHSCGKCSKGFDKRYLLTWAENVNNF